MEVIIVRHMPKLHRAIVIYLLSQHQFVSRNKSVTALLSESVTPSVLKAAPFLCSCVALYNSINSQIKPAVFKRIESLLVDLLRALRPNNASMSPTSRVIVKYIYSTYLYLFNQTMYIVTGTIDPIDCNQQKAEGHVTRDTIPSPFRNSWVSAGLHYIL